MSMVDIIRKKRDGQALTDRDIRFFIRGISDGGIPDYQASALLMAMFLNGLDTAETVTLTRAMAESGAQMDLSAIPGDQGGQAFHRRASRIRRP